MAPETLKIGSLEIDPTQLRDMLEQEEIEQVAAKLNSQHGGDATHPLEHEDKDNKLLDPRHDIGYLDSKMRWHPNRDGRLQIRLENHSARRSGDSDNSRSSRDDRWTAESEHLTRWDEALKLDTGLWRRKAKL